MCCVCRRLTAEQVAQDSHAHVHAILHLPEGKTLCLVSSWSTAGHRGSCTVPEVGGARVLVHLFCDLSHPAQKITIIHQMSSA
jgi:hypothetical protein